MKPILKELESFMRLYEKYQHVMEIDTFLFKKVFGVYKEVRNWEKVDSKIAENLYAQANRLQLVL